MRIIAGTLKGRSVRGPQSKGTRPILARVRKSLFDILRPQSDGARFLDLFSGTGCVGIEAVSRGVQRAVCVENNVHAAQQIEQAVHTFHIEDHVRLYRCDVFAFIKQSVEQFDIIFAGPPYDAFLCEKILTSLSESKLVLPTTIIVLQHERKENIPEHVGVLSRYRQERYGSTMMSFYKKGVTQ